MKRFLFLIFVAFCGGYSLPSYIQKCNVNNDNLGQCIVDQIPKVRPHLKNGIPEITLPSLVPYKVPEVVIDAGENKMLKLTDVEVFGLEDFQMIVLDLNATASFAKYKFFFKKLNIQSINMIDKQMIVLPIKEMGPIKIEIIELDINHGFNYAPVTRDGVLFMTLFNQETSYISGNFRIYKEICNNAQESCKQLNMFMQDDWNNKQNILMTAIAEMVGVLIEKVFSDILERIPADVLYDLS